MTTKVQEALEKWQAKAEEAKRFFDDHMAKEKLTEDESRAGIDTFRQMAQEAASLYDAYKSINDANTEAEKLNQQLAELQKPDRQYILPQGQKNNQQGQFKTIGELIAGSQIYRDKVKGISRPSADWKFPEADPRDYIGLKTTMTTSAGFAPANNRTNIVVPFATEDPMVADLIPQITVDNDNIIKWMEQTTFTNNAAGVAENGAKPEAALAYTERSASVRKIAQWIPVTEEQLSDVPQLRAIIENDLALMLRQEEADQLLNGDNNSPNLNGLYTAVTQTQAKGTDSVPSAFYKAMTKVEWTGFAKASGHIMHPNDWQDIALLQDANGNFIMGSPTAPVSDPRLWGLPVVRTTYATENTGLTGDFRNYTQIVRRQGLTIKVTDSHSDYFIYNRLVILAEIRLALLIKRAAAFCEVTGI